MRQLTCNIYTIGTEELVKAEDGRYDLNRTPLCTAEDTKMDKTTARAALAEAGVSCPRGTKIYWEVTGQVQYKFTTEDLKAIAKERIEL